MNATTTEIGGRVPGAPAAAPQPGRGRPGVLAGVSRGEPALVVGVIGLLLAAIGEALVDYRESPTLKQVPGVASLAFYVAGIALFVASARGAWLALAAARPEAPVVERGRRRWLVLGVGLAISLGLTAWSTSLIVKNLKTETGGYVWIAAMLALIATGIAAGRDFTWPSLWEPASWPSGRRERWLALGAIASILLVAGAARLLFLDTIPWGINADEGDRAALSIQILRGQKPEGVFDYGWYRIHMIYFWLVAQWMRVVGIGFVQARMFGGLFSIASVGIVLWMAIRQFGLRTGLLAGALLAVLGASLQFARETTEATPTATLWVLSLALFLEGMRRGRPWAWIGAGMAGALSIYFYPSARLWPIFAVGVVGYALLHGLGGRRVPVLGRGLLGAVGAVVAGAPFFALAYVRPDVISSRAEDVSIFTQNNPVRLAYYQPSWPIWRLVVEQVVRTVGIFNQFADRGGVWPTEAPLLRSSLLAVLTLVGLGWICLRWRDPRFVALAVFVWVGLLGVIVTVETPNFHRMTTAVPVIALLPMLVLGEMGARVDAVGAGRVAPARWAPRWTTVVMAALVGWMMWSEAHYYFVDYAAMDRWSVPTRQGEAVARQGTDTLVMTLGRAFHVVNSGWVRLLAPFTPRGGVESPGDELPLTVPSGQNLAFMVMRPQSYYLPYLRELYPTGVPQPEVHPTEGLMFTIYRVPKEDAAAQHGATAQTPDGRAVRVATLGAVPTGLSSYPAPVRWTAGLRVERYWNYSFRIGPGPARMTIDGVEVAVVPAGAAEATSTVALARGDHAVVFEGVVAAADRPATFEWMAQPTARQGDPPQPAQWRAPRAEELIAAQTAPHGLYAVAQVQGRPEVHRLDNTLATCCYAHYLRPDDRPYTVTWRGTLTAPKSGTYKMGFFEEGTLELRVDGQSVLRASSSPDEAKTADVPLTAGPHQVEIAVQAQRTNGAIEWIWTPPDGETSIVPPSVLTPPTGVLVGPPVSVEALGQTDWQPVPGALNTLP
ncbi:MAG TPA: glycosyltransferase family 39 protein [Chloroflexota bacterium]|nr:glycosyltransferase family 39 protein [Chloroflexota bacterium]